MNDKNLLPMEKFNLIWPSLFFLYNALATQRQHVTTRALYPQIKASKSIVRIEKEDRAWLISLTIHTLTMLDSPINPLPLLFNKYMSIYPLSYHLRWIMEVGLAVLVCHDLTTGFQKFWFIKKLVVHSAFPTMRGTKYKIPLRIHKRL